MKLNYNNELYHNDEFLQWWIFIKITNIYHKHKFSSIDEFSWPWWIFIVLFILIKFKNNHQLMKFLLDDQFHHQDESSSQRLILINWWIFITMTNFVTPMILYPNDEFSSYWWIFIKVKNLSNCSHECYHNA